MGGFHGGHDGGHNGNGIHGGHTSYNSSSNNRNPGGPMDHGPYHPPVYSETVSVTGSMFCLFGLLEGFGLFIIIISCINFELLYSIFLIVLFGLPSIIGGIFSFRAGMRRVKKKKIQDVALKEKGIMPAPGSLAPIIIATSFSLFFILTMLIMIIASGFEVVMFLIFLFSFICFLAFGYLLIREIKKHKAYNKYVEDGGVVIEDEDEI